VAQYYNFLRLGADGYRAVQSAAGTQRSGWRPRSSASAFHARLEAEGIPVFAFRLTEDAPYSVYDISDTLRSSGWLVLPTHSPRARDVSVLRVVVRNGFSRDSPECSWATCKKSSAPLRPQLSLTGQTKDRSASTIELRISAVSACWAAGSSKSQNLLLWPATVLLCLGPPAPRDRRG